MSSRIKNLRKLMQQHHIDFYYVPSADAHQNEYVPECWQRRSWISGFTGSAGDVVVGFESALLCTDGRYRLQADQQVDHEIFEVIIHQTGILPTLKKWLRSKVSGKTLACDAKTVSMAQAKALQEFMASMGGQCVLFDDNLIDQLQDSIALPQATVHIHPVEYSGQKLVDKLDSLRDKMQSLSANAHVITTLDAIAWLLNIRGADVDYNPLVIAYAIVTEHHATLFINQNKLSADVLQHLNSQGVQVKDYQQFAMALNQLSGTVLLDQEQTNAWVVQQLLAAEIINAPSPIDLAKAIKNPVEQAGAKASHQRDATAMIEFLTWLEQHIDDEISECHAADKLEEYRSQQDRFKGLSFPTISAFASHGAIVHYCAERDNCKTINRSNLYLLDSGGQYLDGTTDITRTLHFGEPTAKQKRHYTRVLQGHLALRHAVFAKGTCGEHLDALARLPLWQEGIHYQHGTGHGVGSYLCVHEGPQRISPGFSHMPLAPGMIVSNEPGAYFPGEYGIRIENLVLVKPVVITDAQTQLYGFDDLTLVPYARNLIEVTLLSQQEIEHINTYHRLVFNQLYHTLSTDAQAWLEKATAML